MHGLKALALEAYCQSRNIAYTRFDYSGHGHSDGTFEEGDIGAWLSDALYIFDNIAAKQNPSGTIVIGSSMGAWVATLLAMQRDAEVNGLITIAAAPDFTEELLLPSLNTSQLDSLKRGETIYLPSDYDDGSPYPITANLIQQSRKHCVLARSLNMNIPVRLLHGTADKDVPHTMSVSLMEAIRADDVILTLIKNADHRLSNKRELKILTNTIDELLQ